MGDPNQFDPAYMAFQMYAPGSSDEEADSLEEAQEIQESQDIISVLYEPDMPSQTYLDSFPDSFSRKSCEIELAKNQYNLMRSTRQDLYKIISQSQLDCDRVVKFEFPSRLWHNHRKTIALEVLDKFEFVKILLDTDTNTTKLFYQNIVPEQDPDELQNNGPDRLPEQIKAIIIEFAEKDIIKKTSELAVTTESQDKFPQNFNREHWESELIKNQNLYMRKIRGDIYAKLTNSIDKCEPFIKLDLTSRLWNSNRKVLVKELLDRFQMVKISDNAENEKIILSTDLRTPDHIRYVTIEFSNT